MRRISPRPADYGLLGVLGGPRLVKDQQLSGDVGGATGVLVYVRPWGGLPLCTWCERQEQDRPQQGYRENGELACIGT